MGWASKARDSPPKAASPSSEMRYELTFGIDRPGRTTIEFLRRSASLVDQQTRFGMPIVVDNAVGHFQCFDIPGISGVKDIALIWQVFETDLVDITDGGAGHNLKKHRVCGMS